MGTEGEGVHIGRPQIFVRFQGCTIGCVNCDSKETWDFSQSHSLSFADLTKKIFSLSDSYKVPLKTVSITGGDPLHIKHRESLLELIDFLKSHSYYINLEAAGTVVVPEVFDKVDFISFDYKTPSTHVKTRFELMLKMLQNYTNKTQFKSIVSDKKDFSSVLDMYYSLPDNLRGIVPWCLTPCYENKEDFPGLRFEELFNLNTNEGGLFRVIGQQHKWVYGADAKRV